MTIRSKMSLLVVLVLVVAAAVALGAWTAVAAEQAAEEDADHHMMARMVAGETEAAMLRYMGSISQVLGELKEGAPDEATEELEEAEEHDVVVDEMLTQLEEMMAEEHVTDGLRAQVAVIREEWTSVDDLSEQSIDAVAAEAGLQIVAGETDMTEAQADAEELEDQLEEAEEVIDTHFDEFEEALDALVAEAGEAAEAADARMNIIVFGGLGAIVVLTAVFGFGLVSSVSRELRRAEDFAAAVAEGRMDVEFGEHTTDEVGSMTRSVETMRDALVQRVENLREMAGVVMVTSDNVKAATTEARASLDRVEGGGDALIDAKAGVDSAVKSAETLGELSKQMLDI